MTQYPVGYNLPSPEWSPSDIREWEKAWDALLAGETGWKHKVMMLSRGATITVLPGPRCRYCKSVASGDTCEKCGAPQ